MKPIFEWDKPKLEELYNKLRDIWQNKSKENNHYRTIVYRLGNLIMSNRFREKEQMVTIKEADKLVNDYKRFIDREELNKALYDLNKDNYDNVYLYGDIITGRIERTLYNIEKKINKNIDIQKKAFKDSKIIKKRIKEKEKKY